MRWFEPRSIETQSGRAGWRCRARWCAALAALVLVLLVGCGTEAPADWQWWTSADSEAVRTELAGWRGSLNAHRALSDTLRLDMRIRLTAADSTSVTGSTLYKFAHLLKVWVPDSDSGHVNEYHFGVTVDTMVLHDSTMADTFCQVDYYDRRWVLENGGADTMPAKVAFSYDSLWVVTFRPETVVVPPDTTIIWRVSSTELRGFDAPQETTKTWDWSARRVVFLRKDSAATAYHLNKMSGFAVFAPSSADAPGISQLVLSKPGQADTFFYQPRPDGRGLYNLRTLDSLYTVQQGEERELLVTTSTPPDTTTDKNRFFLGTGGARTEITAGAKRGVATITFADTGYQHIYVEVIPLSSLLYKDQVHKTATWALPVRVLPVQ